VTAKDCHNKAVLRKYQQSGFSRLFWDFCDFFFTFCDFFLLFETVFYRVQKPSHCDGHKCDHLWRFRDSLNVVTMKTVKLSFISPSLAGFFVIICYLVYFYTSLTYSTNLYRTNINQKSVCFWWSNITSLLNFGSNYMLLMFNKWQF
jgi:hypothetical protein